TSITPQPVRRSPGSMPRMRIGADILRLDSPPRPRGLGSRDQEMWAGAWRTYDVSRGGRKARQFLTLFGIVTKLAVHREGLILIIGISSLRQRTHLFYNARHGTPLDRFDRPKSVGNTPLLILPPRRNRKDEQNGLICAGHFLRNNRNALNAGGPRSPT